VCNARTDRLIAASAATGRTLLLVDTGRGAARHGRPVGVCGGLASDPAAAALLVGSDVTELSCTPAAVHDVTAAIRQVDLAACRKARERGPRAGVTAGGSTS